ncbi:uncharacterized protein LOC111899568 [Lactuca sativa]|uniref:uncharacterized protein LOC111899568 n=1 Tax=Lactuca sativa TaxID=4236 RepID=UPI0022AE60E9|nr:uncharacterized protein LOC111899568 [Lactuca sativa]
MKHDGDEEFFEQLDLVVTVVGGSCKRKDMIQEMQKERVESEIGLGETVTGTRLNQEFSLFRAGDTRYGSQYRTITLEFVFLLHLILEILGLTNTLSKHLKKDQDILEVTSLVKGEKKTLLVFRKDGFPQKLLKLSDIYKNDFDDSEMMHLNRQVDIYYHFLFHDEKIFNLNRIADVSLLLVETGKHLFFSLVYGLLKLTLVLSVATATVERYSYAMTLLKTDLHNRIGDDFMNSALICSVEKKYLRMLRLKM